MKEKIVLNYYYGSEAEQFSFYRVPKLLLTDDYFNKISSDAKILYSILLDRMSLSIKNHWVDKNNRVFIIYTIAEVMYAMHCGEHKAINLMAELDTKKGIGLIEKKQRGLGKPNLIYVKNFKIDKDYSYYAGTEDNDQSVECVTAEIEDCNDLQFKGCTTMPDKNCTDMQVKKFINEQPRNCTTGGPNYTDCDLTNISDTDLINQSKKIKENSKINDIELFDKNLKMIKQNIGYNDFLLKLDSNDIPRLNEILEIMAVFVTFKRDIIKIKGVEYPYDFVRMKILKNDHISIEYLFDSFNRNTSNKPNIEGYVISMLFNAPSTVNNYYKSAVNHDMAYFDWKHGKYRTEEP